MLEQEGRTGQFAPVDGLSEFSILRAGEPLSGVSADGQRTRVARSGLLLEIGYLLMDGEHEAVRHGARPAASECVQDYVGA